MAGKRKYNCLGCGARHERPTGPQCPHLEGAVQAIEQQIDQQFTPPSSTNKGTSTGKKKAHCSKCLVTHERPVGAQCRVHSEVGAVESTDDGNSQQPVSLCPRPDATDKILGAISQLGTQVAAMDKRLQKTEKQLQTTAATAVKETAAARPR